VQWVQRIEEFGRPVMMMMRHGFRHVCPRTCTCTCTHKSLRTHTCTHAHTHTFWLMLLSLFYEKYSSSFAGSSICWYTHTHIILTQASIIDFKKTRLLPRTHIHTLSLIHTHTPKHPPYMHLTNNINITSFPSIIVWGHFWSQNHVYMNLAFCPCLVEM